MDQWKAADKALDNYYYHLMYIGQLAGVESPHINQNLPAMIFMYEEMKKLNVEFRKHL